MSATGEGGRPGRPTIEERAARREALERAGSSRFGVLLRVLRAGSRIPPEVRTRAAIQWHPIFWVAVRLVLLGIAAWIIASAGVRLWRQSHVDTWSGPDSSVASGQRLADCPVVNAMYDDLYPTWVRFRGSIFRSTGRPFVFGSNAATINPWSGYRLGSLELDLITDTPEGRAGGTIALRFTGSLVGQLYRLTPECS